MSDEPKNDDLQSLAKEQVHLMKRLIMIVGVQALFIIALAGVMLWMIVPGLISLYNHSWN